jgi:hypothetical protein
MSDTPRTDAEAQTCMDTSSEWHGEWVRLDFARQLERELTDARQIASKYDDRYFATRELLNVSTERAERLERELTEARTRIKELADIGGDLAGHVEYCGCQQCCMAIKDWEETVKRCLEGIE